MINETNFDKSVLKKTVNKTYLNYNNRMTGKIYKGLNKGIVCEKNPRKMGLRCQSKYCEKSTLRHCSQYDENIRQEIFDGFWNMSWKEKKIYVISQVELEEKARNRNTFSRRSLSKRYYLKAKATRIQVCRQMFMSTLGINEKMIRNWVDSNILKHTQLDIAPPKGTSKNAKKYEKRLNFLKKWLNSIPKLESHYRRQYSTKNYLQTDIKSYNQLYKLYCEECDGNNDDEILPVSYPKFMLTIKQQNISLFKPRNDMCDICVSFEAKNITEDQYNSHRSQINEMRKEKENDIESAKSGLCLLLCMDMQAVKLIPQTNASASYYKMKLQVHNFTIYNIITHESDNYIWDESEGNLVASTTATCIVKYLEKCLLQSPDTSINHVIIYSDGCFYQNRNVLLSNALLSLCIEKNITIEHKYLIVGHTQMECDSTHSLIQRKINNKKINLPSEFVQYVKDSRKTPFPLNTHHLTHSYFRDYDSLPKRYSSIRPGNIIKINFHDLLLQ